MSRFLPYSLGVASGWMKLRGTRRRRGADRGFVLSDHCDWNDLNTAIKETGAQRIFVTHGYTEIFAQWLNTQGLEAKEVKTKFEGELGEMAEGGFRQVEEETKETVKLPVSSGRFHGVKSNDFSKVLIQF
jgi:putative mRNA 3-end processing factor